MSIFNTLNYRTSLDSSSLPILFKIKQSELLFNFILSNYKIINRINFKSSQYFNIIEAIVFVRISVAEYECFSIISAVLKNFGIPIWLTKAICFLPVGGTSSARSSVLLSYNFDTEDKVRISQYIKESFINDYSMFARLCSTSRSQILVPYNDDLLAKVSKNFVLNSFFVFDPLFQSSKLYVTGSNVEMSSSLALTIIFGLHPEERRLSDIMSLVSSVGYFEVDQTSLSLLILEGWQYFMDRPEPILLNDSSNVKTLDNSDRKTELQRLVETKFHLSRSEGFNLQKVLSQTLESFFRIKRRTRVGKLNFKVNVQPC